MLRVRLRLWLEVSIAGFGTAMLVLTLVWPDWIEGTFAVNPDEHSGSLEQMAVVVLLAAATLCSMSARRTRQTVAKAL